MRDRNDKELDKNFDQYSDRYNEIFKNATKISGGSRTDYAWQKIGEVVRFEKKLSPSKILDFGCGDGLTSAILKQAFPHAEIVGIDTSSRSLEKAESIGIPGTSFIKYDGVTLPFDGEEFDFVFVANVFHHIEKKDHSDIVRELHRVLKMRGRVYNFEHNPRNPFTQKVVRDCEFDKDAVLLSSSYHQNLMQDQFSYTKLCFTLFFPRKRLFKGFHWLERFLYWLPIGGQYFVRSVK